MTRCLAYLLPRSFSGQLLGFATLLLLAMALLAAFLGHRFALQPSAEQMARSLVVLAEVAEQQLSLHSGAATLAPSLIDAGVFPVLPVGSQTAGSLRPFPRVLRDELARRLSRPAQLVLLPDGELALWFAANSATQMPFGLRFEGQREPLVKASALTMLASAIALLLAAGWLARWLSRPMRRLSAALPAVAAGAPMPRLGRLAPAELRELAGALDGAMRRLREQSQQRELTLAGISHDLRTPLMRIALALQMLPEHPRIAAIETDITEMDQLIGAALELARAGQEPAEEVLLAPLLQHLLGDRQTDWRLQIDPSLALRVPPIALRRALDNLLQNAMRHGQPPYSVSTQRDQGHLSLAIGDHGPGLGKLDAESARMPFQQGSESSKGSGLGLAIVDQLAANFDSQLQLRHSAEGLTAILSIPLARVVGSCTHD